MWDVAEHSHNPQAGARSKVQVKSVPKIKVPIMKFLNELAQESWSSLYSLFYLLRKPAILLQSHTDNHPIHTIPRQYLIIQCTTILFILPNKQPYHNLYK